MASCVPMSIEQHRAVRCRFDCGQNVRCRASQSATRSQGLWARLRKWHVDRTCLQSIELGTGPHCPIRCSIIADLCGSRSREGKRELQWEGRSCLVPASVPPLPTELLVVESHRTSSAINTGTLPQPPESCADSTSIFCKPLISCLVVHSNQPLWALSDGHRGILIPRL